MATSCNKIMISSRSISSVVLLLFFVGALLIGPLGSSALVQIPDQNLEDSLLSDIANVADDFVILFQPDQVEHCFYDTFSPSQPVTVAYATKSADVRSGSPHLFHMELKDKSRQTLARTGDLYHGRIQQFVVPSDGEYQYCIRSWRFRNQLRKVYIVLSVPGRPRESSVERLQLLQGVEEAETSLDHLRKSFRPMYQNLHHTSVAQRIHKRSFEFDFERMQILQNYLDKWSTFYSVLVICIGLGQVFLLKNMFNSPSDNKRMRTRT